MKRTLTLTLVCALLMMAVAGLTVTASAEVDVPEIRVMMSPWVSSPMPEYESDPYNQYLDEAYGAKFTLDATSDFDTEVLLRFASGNAPDLIIFNNSTILKTLYAEDVMLDDWTPYTDRLTQTMGNLTDLVVSYFTNEDGKMIAMPTKGGSQLWSLHIRKDWLANLNLEMPTDAESLLEVARAFTFDDPDGNGADDTYAFTAAGEGKETNDFRRLLQLFGESESFYVKDGEVTHPFLDGSFQQYLDYAKTIVDEKLIDPDWYTQGWQERKPNLFQGKFGIVWYPSEALLTEINEGRGNDQEVIEWYEIMDIPGMLTPPSSMVGTIRSVSAECAADEAKMNVILSLFEDTALPNDAYYKVRYGYEIDNFIKVDLDGGYVYINKTDTSEYHACTNTTIPALWNWGRIVCSYSDGYLGGPDPEPNEVVLRVAELNTKWETLPKYAQDYQLLSPDPTLTEESNRVRDEFEINYILGNTTDYDAFIAEWRSVAGDALLDDATKTFQKYGVID